MIRSISAWIFCISFILGIVIVCEKVYIIKKFIYTFGSKKPIDSKKSYGQHAADLYKKRGF